MLSFALAVGLGGMAGSILRWLVSVALNPIWPAVPLGTLLANIVGCFFIGLLSGFFASHAALAPEWRLAAITGVLGGFTTFSTFSFEVITLIQEGRFLIGLGAIVLHLGGGLFCAALGLMLAGWVWGQ